MFNKLALTVVLVGALVSCGPRPDGGSKREPPASSEVAQSMDLNQIRSVATHRPTEPSRDAQTNGKITLRNGCVVLGPETGSFTVPVFPENAVTFDENGRWFMYGGVQYKVGDEIHLGGRPVNQDPDRFTNLQLNGCPKTDHLWMVG